MPSLATPTRPIALRFSVIDESSPLSADVDSDDEAAAHKGSPCLGRALTPPAPRSASGSCEWALEAPINITITKTAALRSSPRCSSLSPLAGLVLVIEAFGYTSPNKDNEGKRALLATGRMNLAEQVNAQRHRPRASVLIVPLQAAGRAASMDAPIELGLSLSCQAPASRTQPPLALAGNARENQPEPTAEDEKEEVVVPAPMIKTQPGEQEEQQHKQEEVELKQEAYTNPKPEPKLEAEPELGSIVAMVRVPSQPAPLRRSSLPPLPPPTPARVEALRQWEQWQREHCHHQQQKQKQHQQHQQQRVQSKGLRPTPCKTSCAPAGARQEDASVRRAQLARVRSLLDELESLPESLEEIRAATASSSSIACKAPPRPEIQPEAVVAPPTRRAAPLRRPGKTRAGMM